MLSPILLCTTPMQDMSFFGLLPRHTCSKRLLASKQNMTCGHYTRPVLLTPGYRGALIRRTWRAWPYGYDKPLGTMNAGISARIPNSKDFVLELNDRFLSLTWGLQKLLISCGGHKSPVCVVSGTSVCHIYYLTWTNPRVLAFPFEPDVYVPSHSTPLPRTLICKSPRLTGLPPAPPPLIYHEAWPHGQAV